MSADHFSSAAVARGYAAARPAVHGPLVEHVRRALGPAPVGVAVDLGCGAGASTAPLVGWAERVVGLDPFPAMVRAAAGCVPGASFVVARGERLPLEPGSVDLLTAAGALDFTDLDAFGPEACRVLAPGGHVVAYDFGRGRRLQGSTDLDGWYDDYLDRSGRVPVAGDLPDRLATVPRLRRRRVERVVVEVAMDLREYVAYVMTDALDASDPVLRAWCETTLAPIFPTARVVELDAWFAVLTPRSA